MNEKMRTSSFYALVLCFFLASCQEKETVIPVRKSIEEAVFASGYIEQENNYTVSAKVEGILVSMPVKEGDFVQKKDLIASIESTVQEEQLQDAVVVHQDAIENAAPTAPQLQNIQVQMNQAKQQLEFDKTHYLKYKGLWEKNSISKLEFDKAELQYKAAQNNLQSLQENYTEAQNALALNVERSKVQVNTQQSLLKDYKLQTEVSGQIIQVFKKQGELARRGEAIAKIGSGDHLVKLFVAEEDITSIDIGQLVAVNINTYPDKTFRAVVSKIYPGFDETEQSYVVEAQLEQVPQKLFSGTQLQANIETGKRKDVLVIPTDYVSKGNLVVLENGEERQIITGNQNSIWTEVVSGISENDIIVKNIN